MYILSGADCRATETGALIKGIFKVRKQPEMKLENCKVYINLCSDIFTVRGRRVLTVFRFDDNHENLESVTPENFQFICAFGKCVSP